jgi:hypothetical protein
VLSCGGSAVIHWYGGRQYVCQKDAANKNHVDLILGVGRSSLCSLYLSTIHISQCIVLSHVEVLVPT